MPEVGMIVCDCKYAHLKIIELIDDDTIVLEDGSVCSFEHCCDVVQHPDWEHPEVDKD